MSINVCWQCREVLDRETTPKCPICGWNICPDDGACTDPHKPEYGKCVCSYATEKEERSYLRICYAKGERTKEEFLDVAREYLDVYRENKAREAREKAAAARREKEEQERKEREQAEALRNTIIRDRILQRYIEGEYVGEYSV